MSATCWRVMPRPQVNSTTGSSTARPASAGTARSREPSAWSVTGCATPSTTTPVCPFTEECAMNKNGSSSGGHGHNRRCAGSPSGRAADTVCWSNTRGAAAHESTDVEIGPSRK